MINYSALLKGLHKSKICDHITLIQKDLKNHTVTEETLRKVAQLEGMTEELFEMQTTSSNLDFRYLISRLGSNNTTR